MKSLLLRALALLSLTFVLPMACGGDPEPSKKPETSTPPDDSDDGLCETNADCTAADKPYCDGFSGCVSCVLDDHCGEGRNCDEHECVDIQACSSNPDCTMAEATVCNFVLGQCAECVYGPECGEGHICNQGECQAVTDCVNSLDCPTGTVCDRDLSFCVDCITDGDCEETHACVANECIWRCNSDKDCTSDGELCNSAAGYCVECVEDVDCPELYHCDQGSCNVDLCIAGESSCNNNLNVREVCEPNGSGSYTDSCDFGTTCVESGAFASCTPWTCSPGTAACDQTGTSLVVCDADGLGGTTQTDCSAVGGVCENQACVDVVCEAGLKFCDGSTVMQCSDSGTSFTSVNVCGTNEHCDVDAQGCALNVCTPNTNICEGNILKTCNADGSGYLTEETDCEDDGGVCFASACKPKACDAGPLYCNVGNVYSCLDNESRAQLTDTCSSTTEYCEDGQCKTNVCTPNQPACDGEVTGVCNAEGNGIDTSAGTDCANLTDKACWNGVCEDKICEPGEQSCNGQERLNCINNGSATSISTTCGNAYYCQDLGATTTCTTRICTAGSPACNGNLSTTCNSNGSGYEAGGTACDSDEQCVSGTCLPVICNANERYCDTGNPYLCGADGTTSQQTDTCTSSEFCQEGTAYCISDVCTNGQPTCDGELVTTCADDGSEPLPGGTACPTGQTCDTGTCKDIFCTPGNEYCDGTYRRTCNATGTGYSASTLCSSNYYCAQEDAGTTACRLDICSPSTATCDGETLATCGADGGTFTGQGTDCSSTSQLCDGSGCVDTLTESVGASTYSSSSYCSNYRLGNRYAFNSARTLTEIRQYLNITGTIQLSWVIYELDSTSISGTYSLVYEKLTTSTGLQYHSSGTISFVLDPAKFYVVGVRPAGACTAYYGATSAKTYLPGGGYVISREYESDSSTLATTWNFTGTSYVYNQELVFE